MKILRIKLIKVSFTISLIGIISLLLLTNILQPKTIQINQLTTKHLNNQIKIQGQIINTKTINPTFQILTIQDSTGKITATINNPLNTTLISQNQTFTITGKVTEYQNNLQIEIDEIIR